jgi:tetratricopeptide (TPR) repeat protein
MSKKFGKTGIDLKTTNIYSDSNMKVKLFEFCEILLGNGLFREAEVTFRGLLHALPGDFESSFNLAHSLHLQGRRADAIQIYQELLRLQPLNVRGWSNLGGAFLDDNQVEKAEEACRKAITIAPDFTSARVNLASCLSRLRKVEEGEMHSRLAIAQNPNNPLAYHALSSNLNLLQKFDESVDACEKSLALKPNQPNTYFNLGFALRSLGRLDEAQNAFLKAIEASPDLAFAHYSLGQTYLLKGLFEEGWKEYEWRWLLDEYRWLRDGHGDFIQPRWRGEALAGKTILVYAEQGFGDTLQFVRYIPRVKQLGAKVVLAVQPALVHVCQGLKGVNVISLDDQFPQFDYHSPLLSLPQVFGTNGSNIPKPFPYLEAEPDRKARWRGKLGSHGFRIGIIWQGRPGTTIDLGRSPPLAEFGPLAAIPGVRLISLQKADGLEQLSGLPDSMAVETLGEDFDQSSGAFRDTVAVFSSLDLVISSDTAVAHLAGTFGIPVWMSTMYVPDWRWLFHGDSTPWYPSMRLYRQPSLGDWTSVFARMATDLAALVASKLPDGGVGTRAVGGAVQ